MSRHSKARHYHPVRHDHLIQEREHDVYKSRWKLPEPTLCPDCGAVFQEGRWHWAPGSCWQGASVDPKELEAHTR